MKIKRIFVLFVVLVFAASLFCFSASAGSHEIDLNNITPTSPMFTSGISKSSPDSQGNITYSVSYSTPNNWVMLSFDLPQYNFDIGPKYKLRIKVGYLDSIPLEYAALAVGDGVSSGVSSGDFSFSSGSKSLEIVVDSDKLSTLKGFNNLLFSFKFKSNVSTGRVWINRKVQVQYLSEADRIIENQDKNTDKFIEGDGTPLAPDHNKDMDDKSNQIKDLENGALGGKTDEQIQQEVDNALSFDTGSLDGNASQKLSGLFDGLLVVFGVDYQSLLMLALSLGLAAFIIGRRYKA